MLDLRLLGTPALRRDGVPARAVLAQPKRFALLVYLAAAHPDGARRDSLLAAFWPEQDQDHARSALRQGIAFLRRELGDDLFSGDRDETLRVGPGLVQCDVIAFRAACAAGRWRE